MTLFSRFVLAVLILVGAFSLQNTAFCDPTPTCDTPTAPSIPTSPPAAVGDSGPAPSMPDSSQSSSPLGSSEVVGLTFVDTKTPPEVVGNVSVAPPSPGDLDDLANFVTGQDAANASPASSGNGQTTGGTRGASDDGKSFAEKYAELLRILNELNKDMAKHLLDPDPAEAVKSGIMGAPRTAASFQMTNHHLWQLVTDEEFETVQQKGGETVGPSPVEPVFGPVDPLQMIQDFEKNTENVSGGYGPLSEHGSLKPSTKTDGKDSVAIYTEFETPSGVARQATNKGTVNDKAVPIFAKPTKVIKQIHSDGTREVVIQKDSGNTVIDFPPADDTTFTDNPYQRLFVFVPNQKPDGHKTVVAWWDRAWKNFRIMHGHLLGLLMKRQKLAQGLKDATELENQNQTTAFQLEIFKLDEQILGTTGRLNNLKEYLEKFGELKEPGK